MMHSGMSGTRFSVIARRAWLEAHVVALRADRFGPFIRRGVRNGPKRTTAKADHGQNGPGAIVAWKIPRSRVDLVLAVRGHSGG